MDQDVFRALEDTAVIRNEPRKDVDLQNGRYSGWGRQEPPGLQGGLGG